MRRWLRDNSLSLVCFTLFLGFAFGQSLTGHRDFNADARAHRETTITYGEYLTDGHFVESVFENWESEFVQMGAFVLLTVFLTAQVAEIAT